MSFFLNEHDGTHTLQLVAGMTAVDGAIEEAGHEPNGYFWEGVAMLLVASRAPALDGRFEYDSEGGTFVAHGPDKSALEELRALMATVANDPRELNAIIALAAKRGFQFDD
ncbi:MAG: Imm51 family immunity protein [Sandaracinaceae bacterium]